MSRLNLLNHIEELFQALLSSEFCYVLNSRQMGKSSLWVQTMHRLQAKGICCKVIDLTAIGTQEVTPEQYYASVVGSLSSSFQLSFNIRVWWRDRTPFNIGRAIELKGFELHEAMPLMLGLEGIASQPEALLAQILNWTGGQPLESRRSRCGGLMAL